MQINGIFFVEKTENPEDLDRYANPEGAHRHQMPAQ
jgi:hypothetical protein